MTVAEIVEILITKSGLCLPTKFDVVCKNDVLPFMFRTGSLST